MGTGSTEPQPAEAPSAAPRGRRTRGRRPVMRLDLPEPRTAGGRIVWLVETRAGHARTDHGRCADGARIICTRSKAARQRLVLCRLMIDIMRSLHGADALDN